MPTLAFLGDVMLGRGVNDELARGKKPDAFWGSVLPVLRGADAVIANLECAITRCHQRWWKTPKVFHFRADIAAIEILRAANIRCVTLANNHALDYTEAGLLEMIDYLDRAEIAHAGAGTDLVAAETPAVIDVGGLRIGVISFTDDHPAFAAATGHPGVNYLEIESAATTLARLDEWIAIARGGGAQIILLSPHWGPNMREHPTAEFIDFAHAAFERGVDLFIGHSAHVFQGVEVYRDRLICYDAGDALDDYALDDVLRNDWSFMFVFDINAAGARIERVRLIPLQLRYAETHLAEGESKGLMCQRMLERSLPFGTRFETTGEGLVIAP
jgi:poly-gamma-glutamate capsule biosynthesis protein CapA/YwtB (metallophosphatase superfamily)